MNPNNKQLTKLFQYTGCSRFAYNWTIAKQQENYKQGNKFLSDNKLRKEFTQLKKLQKYKWLNEVSNNVTKQAIKDACNTYKRFFKGQCKYPKFKSKKQSTPSFYQDTVKIQFTSTHVIFLVYLSLSIVKRRLCNLLSPKAKSMVLSNLI